VLATAGLLSSSAGASTSQANLSCKYGVKAVWKVVNGHRHRVRVCKKPAKADIVVTNKASMAQVTNGNRLSYELTVVNRGPSTARNVTVLVSFPTGTDFPSFSFDLLQGADDKSLNCAGSSIGENSPFVWKCELPWLDPVQTDAQTGEQFPQLDLKFVVEPGAAGPYAVEAHSAAARTVDPHPKNSHVTSHVMVLPGPASADLSLAVDALPSTATVTDDLTLTAHITNHGPTEATGVQTTLLLPLGTQFVGYPDVDPDQLCSFAANASTIAVCWRDILPGQTVDAAITLAPIGTSPPMIETDAVVSAFTPDPNLADNRVHVDTPLQPFDASPGVDLVAHIGHPISYEGTVLFPVGVANRGTDAPTNAHALLSFTGPVGQPSLAFIGDISGPAPIGPCLHGDTSLDCIVRELPSGARVNGFIYGQTSGTGTLTATVHATAQGTDAHPADNTVSGSIDVKASPARR